MPTWPSSLPDYSIIAGFSVTYDDNIIRANTDIGPGKVRPRFTKALRTHTIPIIVSTSQKSTLDDFYYISTVSGSLSFTWVDPISTLSMDYEFVEPPKYQPVGYDEYMVTLQLIESIN